MEARLKKLLHASESAIQEMGANILYLALGFLEWFDATSSNNAHLAPLFLVPVKLHKGRLNRQTRTYEYTLSYSGEDIISNLSLREKLRIDFAMALPDLDEDTVPEDYFIAVNSLIKKTQPRWRVRRYISLALLNFSKLLMYLDLDPARWPKIGNIIDHKVVKRFLAGFDQENDSDNTGDLGYGEEYLIDEIGQIHAKYPLIDDADSSQHSALIDAVDGKNLVIEGPPGTGKSQTIANLIAAAVAEGKRVLFVAEKLAALEVVRRRLDVVGLGEFCLELHSHKSQKRKVLEEVGERLRKHGRYRRPNDIEVDIDRYEELKTSLKIHAEKINRIWKNTGKTLHEIFMAATRFRNEIGFNPEKFHPDGYKGENYDAATQRRNEDQVDAYSKVYQAVAHQLDEKAALQEHPWFGVRNCDLQIFDLDRVKESLNTWQESLHDLGSVIEEVSQHISCDSIDIADSLTETLLFLDEVESIPALKGNEILDRIPILRGKILEKTQRYLMLFENIQDQYQSLSKNVGAEILQDLTVVDRFVSGSKQLKKLVSHDVKLGDLAEAIHRLTAVEDQLEQLADLLQGVSSAFGNQAARHLTISKAGLSEFETVIDLITCPQSFLLEISRSSF